MTSTIPSVPVENLSFLYVSGLQLSNDATTPNTILNVQVGQCRDSQNIYDMVFDSSNINYVAGITGFKINLGVNGINGLDTGSIGASTQYYIYAIGASNGFAPTGFLVSTSATAPLMPFSYDLLRLIGYWKTDGSSHLLKAYVVGNGGGRENIYDTPIQVITSGSASTATAVDLSGAVPPVQNTVVQLNTSHTPNAAGGKVTFLPGDSSATVGPFTTGSVASQPNSGQVEVLARIVSSVAKVQYINSAASGSTNAWVQSFKYQL